jgi:hypothetical protein
MTRLLRVVTGVLAMAASLTALAAVVRSDIAQASRGPQVQLADELPTPTPVTMTKISYPPEEEPELFDERVDFGSFEGY